MKTSIVSTDIVTAIAGGAACAAPTVQETEKVNSQEASAMSSPRACCCVQQKSELVLLSDTKRQFLDVVRVLKNWTGHTADGRPLRLSDPCYRYHWNRILLSKAQAELSCYYVLFHALDPLSGLPGLSERLPGLSAVDVEDLVSDLEIFCLVNTTETERSGLLMTLGNSLASSMVALNHMLLHCHASTEEAPPRSVDSEPAAEEAVVKSDRAERLEKRNRNAAKKEVKRKVVVKGEPAAKRRKVRKKEEEPEVKEAEAASEEVSDPVEGPSVGSTEDTIAEEPKRQRNYNTRRRKEEAADTIAEDADRVV